MNNSAGVGLGLDGFSSVLWGNNTLPATQHLAGHADHMKRRMPLAATKGFIAALTRKFVAHCGWTCVEVKMASR